MRRWAERLGFFTVYVADCTGFYVASGLRAWWELFLTDAGIWACLELAARWPGRKWRISSA